MPDPDQQNQGSRTNGRFRKGQSGNPAGRPRGTRHAVTLLAEKLMSDDAEDVVRAIIQKAREGDMVAARLVLERIAPARRDSPVALTLPRLTGPADARDASASIIAAVAAGELTPGEAADVVKLVEAFVRTVETTDIEERLTKLEAILNSKEPTR